MIKVSKREDERLVFGNVNIVSCMKSLCFDITDVLFPKEWQKSKSLHWRQNCRDITARHVPVTIFENFRLASKKF